MRISPVNGTATQATAGGDAKGTPAYMAPELLQHNIFTEKGDVYAYGMIVFEVLTGDTPWSGLNQMQIMMQVCIQKDRPKIDGDAPAAVRKSTSASGRPGGIIYYSGRLDAARECLASSHEAS